MPQKKEKPRKAGLGQANVSGRVTAERLRIRKKQAQGGKLSAAEKAILDTKAAGATQKAAAQALRKSRKMRKKK